MRGLPNSLLLLVEFTLNGELSMPKDKLYLKPNVVAEPLVNQWYAWSHLIAPATACLNIANSHLKIMKSYVASPDIHAAAVKNPAMRGGPFIGYPNHRVGEIRLLIDKTTNCLAHILEFASAVGALNKLLMKEGRGYSLEPIYAEVPEPLKGYVELVYDLNGHPSVRFIESLLYRSRCYDPGIQSFNLSLIESDDRPFVFSTPRLEDQDHLHVNLPFKDEAIGLLFKARITPQSAECLKEALGINGGSAKSFESFLTPHKPSLPSKYTGDGVRVRYFGHACLLLETRDCSIITDPVISYSYENEFPRYTYLDLPDDIDYALITHGHADHFQLETLLQLRHQVKNIIVPAGGRGALEDPSLKLILDNLGFKNVIEVNELDRIDVKDGFIRAVPFLGEHADLNIRAKTAYLINLLGKSVVCAADSSNLEPRLYQHIHDLIGDVDLLFLGMECEGAPLSWIYGQLLTQTIDRKMDQSRRLSGSDFPKATGMADTLNCKGVYIYAMGQEPWLSYLTSILYTTESKPIIESDKLIEACRSRGIPAERLFGSKDIYA